MKTARPIQNDPHPVRETVLENGLKVLLREMPGTGVVSVWCWYRVGSRDERPGITGIAHWVEHMNFKGTEKIPKEEIKARIERVGGSWNGYTYLDVTTYLETVPSGALAGAIELEAERMAHCLYDPAEVDRERTVVISELQGGENDPIEYLEKELIGTALQAHPYRWPTIGYLSDLEGITRDDLESFYRTYYIPNNATVVVTGDLDPGETLALIRAHFGPIPRGAEPPRLRTREPEQCGERRITLNRPGTTTYLEAAFPAPPISDPGWLDLAMADAVLAGGRSLNLWSSLPAGPRKSSRLYGALIDGGLATSISTGLLPTTFPFLYTLQLTVREDASIEEVETGLTRELVRLMEEPVSEREFEKARNQIRARYMFDSDSVADLAHQLGFFETVDSYRTFLNIPERLSRMTPEAIQTIARRTFPAHRRTVGIYRPRPANAEGDRSGGGGAPASRRRPLRTAWPRQVNTGRAPDAGAGPALPTIREVLPNGMVVILQPRPGCPSLAADLTVRAGARFDPAGREGLAHLAALMLDRGTRDRTKPELAEAIDFLGATLARDVDAHSIRITSTMLPEHLTRMLGFLQEIVCRPSFPPEELENARGEVLTALAEEDDDPTAVALRALHAGIYPGGHPYHHPVMGNRDSVGAIRPEDLSDFHARRFRPDAAHLVLAGGGEPGEIMAEVRRAFGNWRAEGRFDEPPVPPVELPAGRERRFLKMPGKTQVEIALGYPGLPRRHPDYYAALLMTHVLGQFGMGGRIGNRIRESEGLAYYAFFRMSAAPGPAPFLARMGVNPDRADRAIDLLLEELERMRRDGATDQEIEDSRRYLTGSQALNLETIEGAAAFLAGAELFGLGVDFHRELPGILAAVSREEVNRAAREHLHPDRALLVLAGPDLPAPGDDRMNGGETRQP